MASPCKMKHLISTVSLQVYARYLLFRLNPQLCSIHRSEEEIMNDLKGGSNLCWLEEGAGPAKLAEVMSLIGRAWNHWMMEWNADSFMLCFIPGRCLQRACTFTEALVYDLNSFQIHPPTNTIFILNNAQIPRSAVRGDVITYFDENYPGFSFLVLILHRRNVWSTAYSVLSECL